MTPTYRTLLLFLLAPIGSLAAQSARPGASAERALAEGASPARPASAAPVTIDAARGAATVRSLEAQLKREPRKKGAPVRVLGGVASARATGPARQSAASAPATPTATTSATMGATAAAPPVRRAVVPLPTIAPAPKPAVAKP